MIIPAKDKNGEPWNQAALFAISGSSWIKGPLDDGTFEMEKSADLDAYYSWAPPIAPLANALTSDASTACSAIVAQIASDQAHLVAFQNGYAAVLANNGEAPSIEPMKTAFASQASAYGKTAEEFAPVVMGIGGASVSLSAALKTLQDAASVAASLSDLATAATAFNGALSQIVASINAAGVPMQLPASVHVGDAG